MRGAMFDEPYSDYVDGEEYNDKINLSDPMSVENALRQRRAKEEKDKEEQKKQRQARDRNFRNERGKRRFMNGVKMIRGWILSLLLWLRTRALGTYWFEVDSETRKSRWRRSFETFIYTHGRKMAFTGFVFAAVLALLFAWKVGVFFGVWGVVPRSDVLFEGSLHIRNAWIVDWATHEEFEVARHRPPQPISDEDFERRFLPMYLDDAMYNVSLARLATAMRQQPCTAATHFGIPLNVFWIHDTWMADPVVTSTADTTREAMITDRYLGAMNVEAPSGARVAFKTQSGSPGRKVMKTKDCLCLAALTSLNGKNVFSDNSK